MIYSRFLHTEFESSKDENGAGAYTIFSTQQMVDINRLPLLEIGIQTFAVFWDDNVDTRLIRLVEQAIIGGSLAPVKILHASKGTLFLVFDHCIDESMRDDLATDWEHIASMVMYDHWNLVLAPDISDSNSLNLGSALRDHIQPILKNHALGITDFTEKMFLFNKDWTPEAVLGNCATPKKQCKKKKPQGPDFSNHDIAL